MAEKHAIFLATLKSNNFPLYAMAALYAGRHELNDCILLNSYDRIGDSTIANIFCIKDKIIYTPPLAEGCVAECLRRYLLEKIKEAGIRDTWKKKWTY